MTVEHDVVSGGDLLVLEAALHRQGRIVPDRVAHHEPAGVAHEPAELDRRHRIGVVEVLAGPALLPPRDGAPDGFLVEARRPREQLELRRRLDRPGVHQRIAAVRDLDVGQPEPEPEPLVVEADAPAVYPQVAHRAPHLFAAVEAIGGAGPLHPVDSGRGARDVGVDVLGKRRKVHRRHDGSAGPDVLHPRRLVERRGQVVVGEDEDGVLGLAAGEDERVGPRLVRPCGRPR